MMIKENSSSLFKIFLCAIFLMPSVLGKSQNLYDYDSSKTSRLSSFENPNGIKGNGGRTNMSAKGNAFESLKIGETKTLLDIEGSGEIQRIWITVSDRSPKMLRSLRLKMYWDGNDKAAVDVPMGDFFGIGLGHTASFESELFSSPEGRSFNSYVPMPFRKGAKIEITNESDVILPLFYFDVDFVTQNQISKDAMYFHAFWTRSKDSNIGEDYVFLPKVIGKGRYIGVNIGVNVNTNYPNTWWGEGEVKMYLDDDDKYPSINGTGAEDYIGTGWELGKYTQLYQGASIVNDSLRQYGFYRYHIKDQIFFHNDFKATIQQIGGGMRDVVRNLINQNVALTPISVQYQNSFLRLLDSPKNINDQDFPNGWVNFYRTDDYSSTAYFYLDKPFSNLPTMVDVSLRY